MNYFTLWEKDKNMVDSQEEAVAPEPNEDWVKAYWRPLMAMQYLFVCIFDFVVAPVLTGILSAIFGIPYMQWHPITLEGGGLYHVSMGAIVTMTAWTRGMEKIETIKNETVTATEETPRI